MISQTLTNGPFSISNCWKSVILRQNSKNISNPVWPGCKRPDTQQPEEISCNMAIRVPILTQHSNVSKDSSRYTECNNSHSDSTGRHTHDSNIHAHILHKTQKTERRTVRHTHLAMRRRHCNSRRCCCCSCGQRTCDRHSAVRCTDPQPVCFRDLAQIQLRQHLHTDRQTDG